MQPPALAQRLRTLAACLIAIPCLTGCQTEDAPDGVSVRLGGDTLSLRVADDEERQRTTPVADVAAHAQGADGLLVAYPMDRRVNAISRRYTVPHDVVYLDASGRVVGTRSVPAAAQDVTIDGQTFTLELATDDPTRLQGLSDRAEVPPDTGMLFVFQRAGVREFVMRRCLVPIDILYLDGAGLVTATHAMTVEPADTPEISLARYSSGQPAVYAVELAGGMLETLDIGDGDTIDLPFEDLQALARGAYVTRYPIRYAIELPSGTLDGLDVQDGQKIDLPTGRL